MTKAQRWVYVALMALLVVFALSGCAETGAGDLVDKWQGENPNLFGVLLHDEDGDGNGDVAIEVDKQGKIVMNPDGSWKEVPGSRADIIDWKIAKAERIDIAAETDAGISNELIFWGTAIGGIIGGVVLKVGQIWGRRKPLAQLAIANDNTREVIFNVEQFRKNATPENWKAFAAGAGKLSEQARAMLKAYRAEIAAANVEDEA